ncbi:MAG: M48 family metallopeptidase [Bacteroidales bacterium]|nr:M48 family metallopeptidase [Bacteroidales bacterium]
MKKSLLVLVVVTLFSSCAKVPISGRKQMNLLPGNIMLSMSLTNYQGILKESTVLSDRNQHSQFVSKIGTDISNAVESYLKKKGKTNRIKGFEWEYNVIKDDVVNAWCMPGGKIAVYTGIIPVTKDKYGMATVLGHEIAHAVAKHGNERMSQQLLVMLGGMSLEVAMKEEPEKTKNIFRAAYGIGTQLGTLAYSRKHEYEADKLGMVFMAQAGYDPAKSIEFWKRMQDMKNGASVPQFISTHPSDENRIKAMKEFLPKAKEYYKPNTK